MAPSVLYVANYVTDDIENEYETEYSLAGNNKMESTIRSLQAVGRDPVVLSPIRLDPTGDRRLVGGSVVTDEAGVDVVVPSQIRIPYLQRPFLILATTALLLKLLLTRSVDALVVYNLVPEHALPALAGRLWRLEIYIEYADGYFVHERFGILYRFERLVRSVEGLFVDGAFAVNSQLADSLQTDNTTVVRGAPSVGMPAELPVPSYAREDRTVVMFAGHFGALRGIDTFLDIAEGMVSSREDVEFWISGYGNDADRVERCVEAMDSTRVRFFGTLPSDDYRNRIVSADVLVNLQDPDETLSKYTFPSKLLDFMASGNVVVSTDVSDVRTLEDFLLVVDDPDDAAGVVADIADTEGDHPTGQRAQQWVEKHCNCEYIGGEILSLMS